MAKANVQLLTRLLTENFRTGVPFEEFLDTLRLGYRSVGVQVADLSPLEFWQGFQKERPNRQDFRVLAEYLSATLNLLGSERSKRFLGTLSFEQRDPDYILPNTLLRTPTRG